MNILEFPDEIICEIYSHMSICERLKVRTTCKQLYGMFKQNIPREKKAEWKMKLMSLMGMALVEKLAVNQNLRYVYRYTHVDAVKHNFRKMGQDYIKFIVDPNLPQDDNVCLGFVILNREFQLVFKDLHNQLVSTNRIHVDDSVGHAVCQFQFKDSPKNLLSENVEYLAYRMAILFLQFVSVSQRKYNKRVSNQRIARLAQQVLECPDSLEESLFRDFDNSNFLNIEEEKTQKTFIYQAKVKEMIENIRKDMKKYFFDGLDAKYVICYNNQ